MIRTLPAVRYRAPANIGVRQKEWSIIRVMPMHTVQMLKNGRASKELIDVMIVVSATAVIINRMMGRPDFHGVPKFRGF